MAEPSIGADRLASEAQELLVVRPRWDSTGHHFHVGDARLTVDANEAHPLSQMPFEIQVGDVLDGFVLVVGESVELLAVGSYLDPITRSGRRGHSIVARIMPANSPCAAGARCDTAWFVEVASATPESGTNSARVPKYPECDHAG